MGWDRARLKRVLAAVDIISEEDVRHILDVARVRVGRAERVWAPHAVSVHYMLSPWSLTHTSEGWPSALKRAVDMAFDPIAFKQTKHILRAAEFLRDLVAREVILLRHVPGKVMVADLLTKALGRALFTTLTLMLATYAVDGVVCPE